MIGIGVVLLSAVAAGVLISTGTVSVPGSALNAEGAIDRVLAQYPELESYRETSLPPSSIETEQVGTTWYVGFVQRGSGVPGIVHAECYLVTAAKNVQVVGVFTGTPDAPTESLQLETCKAKMADTEVPPPAATTSTRTFGEVTLALGETAPFPTLSITPTSIAEDSRCPRDVQCVQAGTVRVVAEVQSRSGTTTATLVLNESKTIDTTAITLLAVEPEATATGSTTPEQYRLTFKVMPEGLVIKPKTTAPCYISGCSAQVCSDKEDVVTTCEFKEEYACYKTAACERQRDGACGWTMGAALTACLADARATSTAQ